MSLFQKASKKQARLRLAIEGPSGTGKTWTALAVATHLGGRVALIDTEHGSADKYAGDFDFDHAVMPPPFDPRNYIEYITQAAREGYPNLVIDSLSHAWAGKGGALEILDAKAKRMGGNSFGAWKDVTPLQNALIDAILSYPGHVIATMRSKVDHIQENDPRTGKTVIRKVGLAPVQREGMDYEFDVVGQMNHEHDMIVLKTRCKALDGLVISRPGKPLAETLLGWLTDGEEAAPAVLLHPYKCDELQQAARDAGLSPEQWINALAKRGCSSVGNLTMGQADELLEKLEGIAAAKATQKEQPQAPQADALSDAVKEKAGLITELIELRKALDISAEELEGQIKVRYGPSASLGGLSDTDLAAFTAEMRAAAKSLATAEVG